MHLDYQIDREAVKRDFSRAASTYDNYASLQREVVDDAWQQLLPHFNPHAAETRLLDVGCGTGYLAKKLQETQPIPSFFQLDLAEGMARRAYTHHSKTLCADMNQLPLRDQTFSHLFSSLCLQWLPRPEKAFSELHRLLMPGGFAMLTTFGEHSMYELKQAFMENNIVPPLYQFSPDALLITYLEDAGFRVAKHHKKPYQVFFTCPYHIKKYFIGLGAHFKAKHPVSNQCYSNVMETYFAPNHLHNGTVPLTFYVDYYLVTRDV